ncbi:MAG: CRISPR-associated endonuclease Cas1 [Thermoanaerobaculia bacterium]
MTIADAQQTLATSPLDLRFERYLVRLRFTRPARFHFQHGVALDGMLRRAGSLAGVLSTGDGHWFPHEVIPFASDSGRIRFDPGDSYQFLLTFVGDAIGIADAVPKGIEEVGRTRPDRSIALPTFGGNFEVERVDHLRPAAWDHDVETLAGRPGVTLRFLSPLRLELPEDAAGDGDRFFDRDAFPAAFFLRRLWQRLFFLGNARYPRRELADLPRLPDGIGAAAPRLLWLDIPKKGAPGAAKTETTGGVVGSVTLFGVPDEWLPYIVLGQYVHIGKSTRYGLGRYVVDGTSLAHDPSLAPSQTLLGRAASRGPLSEALAHVLDDAGDLSDAERMAWESDRDGNLDRLAKQLSTGRYAPPLLHGFLQAKEDGGVRPLVVPPLEDRIAQRAAATILGESIDAILEECSYAYRKGFSRAGAARAITRAYDEGFRHVLDADIASFFDAVDWGLLGAKLDALFPFDPLVELVKRWVQSDVVFEGRRIVRTRGLPQGSPLAPLLANLFLDEFDEILLGRDFRLVRYADDFVVLCRNVDEALAARDEARAALARLGLTFNERKTAVRSIDDGFTYLGYLFCRSVVIEDEHSEPVETRELTVEEIPRFSWLAQVPFERVVATVRPDAAPAKKRAESRPLAPLAASLVPDARALYLLTPGIRVELHDDRVVVSGETTTEVPVALVSHVVCNRSARVTVPLLLELSEQGKPVFFCHRDGSVAASIMPQPPEWTIWQKQAELASDDEACVAVAREIVTAKLHNMATLSMRLRFTRREETADAIRAMEREAANKSELASLRGLEGRGAAIYFGSLRDTLGEEWGFAARRRTPPPDPVNAMLSFGYTILYHHASTSLTAAGLNPRIGIYHRGRGSHDALASDLVEELRHLADAFVISLIRHRQIAPEHFLLTPGGRWPCVMADTARRMFVNGFEERLLEETTPEGAGAMSWRAAIDRQAWQFRAIAGDRRARYIPLRLHA